MSPQRHLKLYGSPEQSVSWVEIDEKGDLVVEFFDYSTAAKSHFGNDIAYLITVSSESKGRVLDLLTDLMEPDPLLDSDEALLRGLQAGFRNYFELLNWLESNNIPFEKSFDPWA